MPHLVLQIGSSYLAMYAGSVLTGQAIDSAWLAANAAAFGGDPAGGPWYLGKAFGAYPLPAQSGGGYPYYLAQDVTASGTAFGCLAANVTLDLNGHALTYDNASPLTLANGGFETGDLTGWDVSGAPNATVVNWTTAPAPAGWMVDGVMHGLEGTYACKIVASTPQVLISSPVTIANRAAEHAVAAIVRAGNSGTAVAVQVYDAADSGLTTPLPVVPNDNYIIYTNGSSGAPANSYEAVCVFPDNPLTHQLPAQVRVKVTVTPSGTDTVYLDGVTLTRSRNYGLMATSSASRVPANYWGLSGVTTPRSVSLKSTTPGGSVAQGASGSWGSDPCFFWSLTSGVSVDGVTFRWNGNSTDCIDARYAGTSVSVTNCTFHGDMRRMRTRKYPALVLNLQNTTPPLSVAVTGNTADGYLHSLTSVLGPASPVVVSGNTVSHYSLWGDPYAIGIGRQVTNFTIANNTITPVSGRGITIDGSGGSAGQVMGPGEIYGNTIAVRQEADLETGGSGVYPVAWRLRNYNESMNSVHVHDNTFGVYRDDTSHLPLVIAARISHYHSGTPAATASNCLVENNLFKAVNSVASGLSYAGAQALSIEIAQASSDASPHPPGWTYRGNVFESNGTSLNIGGADNDSIMQVSDLLFQANTCRKSSLGVGVYTYAPVIMGQYGPVPDQSVRLVSTTFDGGASASYALAASVSQAYSLGYSLTLTCQTPGGQPVSGASVTVTDVTSAVVGSGTSDSSGVVSWTSYLGGAMPATTALPLVTGVCSASTPCPPGSPSVSARTPHAASGSSGLLSGSLSWTAAGDESRILVMS